MLITSLHFALWRARSCLFQPKGSIWKTIFSCTGNVNIWMALTHIYYESKCTPLILYVIVRHTASWIKHHWTFIERIPCIVFNSITVFTLIKNIYHLSKDDEIFKRFKVFRPTIYSLCEEIKTCTCMIRTLDPFWHKKSVHFTTDPLRTVNHNP